MNQFAQSSQIKNPFWAETEDVSLLEAALLSLGIRASALGFAISYYWAGVQCCKA
jgi:hypothetical protein